MNQEQRNERLKTMRKRLVIESGSIEVPQTPTEALLYGCLEQAIDNLDVILGLEDACECEKEPVLG